VNYVVQAGDYLSKIAHQHGFPDWRTIYNHPQNADFRRRRPNPNLIYPGDQLFIPDKDPKTVDVPSGKSTTFVLHGATEKLEIRLIDFEGHPLAGVACALTLDGAEVAVTTDGQGVLRHDIRRNLSQALLTVNGVTTTLQIGQLNPMDDTEDEGVSGVQGRLANLGYYGGAIDGQPGDETREAIRGFRRDNDLSESDAIDAPLKDKLRQKYGS
jgi:N-acetylmuramoyl-L-alanine amidase